MNDKREKQILSIQDYLREKEKEMENNKIVKDNNISKDYHLFWLYPHHFHR